MNKLRFGGVILTTVVVGMLVVAGTGGWDMTSTEIFAGSGTDAEPQSNNPDPISDNADDANSMSVKNVTVHNRTVEGVVYLDLVVAGDLDTERLGRILEQIYSDPTVNASSMELVEIRKSVETDSGVSDSRTSPTHFVTIAIVTDDRSSSVHIINRVEYYLSDESLNGQSVHRTEQMDDSATGYTAVSPGKICKVRVAYYQVDFVVGEPIEQLQGPEGTYLPYELIRFAHGSTKEPIVRLSDGEFITDLELSKAIESHAIKVENGMATVTFSIAEGVEPVKLSLVSYTKPGPGWSRAMEHLQEFVDADTKTLKSGGPYTLRVDLPDAKVGPCKTSESKTTTTATSTDTPTETVTVEQSSTEAPTETVEEHPSRPVQLKVDWRRVYHGGRLSYRDIGSTPQAIFDLDDVKPGDSGTAIIRLHNRAGPSYIWMTGELTANDENGANEPERNAEAHPGGQGDGELAGKVDVTVYYAVYTGPGPYDVETKKVITSGSLEEVMTDLNNGIALDYNPDTSTRNPYPGHETGYLVFAWSLPYEVGNEVQSDSVAFSLKWIAQQSPQNDGNNYQNDTETSLKNGF